MNPKYALGFLLAVLLVVSQLFGEDSTIASVANSSDSELQAAMKDSEEAIKLAASSNKQLTRTRNDPIRSDQTSLDAFYDEVEEESYDIPVEDIVSDADPDEESNVVSERPSIRPGAPSNGKPFEPFAQANNSDSSIDE